MNAAELGEGLLRVMEAHSHCNQNSHWVQDCPILKEFQKYMEKLIELETLERGYEITR